MARRVLRYWRPPRVGFDWDSHERIPGRRVPREMAEFVERYLAPVNRTLWPAGHDAIGFLCKGNTAWLWWRCVVGEGEYGAECRILELVDADFQRFDLEGRNIYKVFGVAVLDAPDVRRAAPVMPTLRYEFSFWPAYLGVAGALYTSLDLARRRSVDAYFSVAPASLTLPDGAVVGFFHRKDAPAVPEVFRSLASMGRSTVAIPELQEAQMKNIEQELNAAHAKPITDAPRISQTPFPAAMPIPSPPSATGAGKDATSARSGDVGSRAAETENPTELAVVATEIQKLSDTIRESMERAQQQRAGIVQELEKLNGRVEQLERVVAGFTTQQREKDRARSKTSGENRLLALVAGVAAMGLLVWNIVITSSLEFVTLKLLDGRMKTTEATISDKVAAETEKWRTAVEVNTGKASAISDALVQVETKLDNRIKEEAATVVRATAEDTAKKFQDVTSRLAASDRKIEILATAQRTTADNLSKTFRALEDVKKALGQLEQRLESESAPTLAAETPGSVGP